MFNKVCPINSKKFPKAFCWFIVIVGARRRAIEQANIVSSYGFNDNNKSIKEFENKLNFIVDLLAKLKINMVLYLWKEINLWQKIQKRQKLKLK